MQTYPHDGEQYLIWGTAHDDDAATGSGKTLAFGLPMILRTQASPGPDPSALILVPTRELAAQVTEALIPVTIRVDPRALDRFRGERQ